MEKKHRCKLCSRNFANGRALGGHMRSHMMKFYAEEKASKQENGENEQPFHPRFQSYSSSTPSSSSSEDEYEEEEDEEGEVKGVSMSSYELRENPRKSAVLVDHDFSSSVVDRESETETESSSEKKKKNKKICRRSKRVRKSRVSDFFFDEMSKKAKLEDDGKSNINEQSSPVSSISDTTPEEHVAHCLIMLSRDKWENEEREYLQQGEDELKKNINNKFRGKYRCEACNKLFRSYQALGGHRASHKKIRAPPPPQAAAAAATEEPKIHKCPFCDRIFGSGQALGGHKRSHFIGANAISTNLRTIIRSEHSRTAQVLNIDLNLPAPLDDDEGSQIAISTVSDAEELEVKEKKKEKVLVF